MLMPASCGVHGPGEITMRSGWSSSISLTRDLVVAAHHDLFAQFAQVLHQVVGERVVVVENEDHGSGSRFEVTSSLDISMEFAAAIFQSKPD